MGRQKGFAFASWHSGNAVLGGGACPVFEAVAMVVDASAVPVAEASAVLADDFEASVADGWGATASNVVGSPLLMVVTTRPTVGALELAELVPPASLLALGYKSSYTNSPCRLATNGPADAPSKTFEMASAAVKLPKRIVMVPGSVDLVVAANRLTLATLNVQLTLQGTKKVKRERQRREAV